MSVLKVRRTYKPAEERRQQILDCALGAFAERGYHDTSIADVCARAGIGRATLYQYFKDKRDLLAALADRIATRVTTVFREREPLIIPAGFKPNEEQAIAFVEARFAEVLGVVFEDAATARLVLRAGRGADGVVDDILRRIDTAVLETIENELRAAKLAGVVRPLDERFVARFFVGGFEKIVMMYLDEDRPIDVAAIAREAALLEVCGVLPRAEPPGETTALSEDSKRTLS
jgi:TetR/AcrR family transcriptional regulator, fatty acid metabolism regulator protein